MEVRDPLDAGVAEAARVIASGGVAVIPTETLYGLAANPLDERAVKRIYEIKKRDPRKPLIVLVSTPRIAATLTLWEPRATALAKAFWPGPLTLVLRARPSLPPVLLGGGATVGVRVPGSPIALAILARAGGVATGTSANISGMQPPRSVDELDPRIIEEVDIVVDAGRLPGTPSTLISLVGRPEVLREGAVPAMEALGVIGARAP